MSNTTALAIATVPAILGIVQVLKDIGLPDRAAPLVAVLLGLAAGLAQFGAVHWSWLPAASSGIALGLSAAGLYSGAKATFIPDEQKAVKLVEDALHPSETRANGHTGRKPPTPTVETPLWETHEPHR